MAMQQRSDLILFLSNHAQSYARKPKVSLVFSNGGNQQYLMYSCNWATVVCLGLNVMVVSPSTQ
jgi:hypothetical protein